MNQDLLRSLNERPIAYYPLYRRLTGSTTAGILLSQLMYWFSKKNKIYKTDADIMCETLLTERELKTAKLKIKELPFVDVTREGVPCKTYYAIDWTSYERTVRDVLVQLRQSSLDESSELDGTNQPNKNGRNVRTITETTAKTTANSSSPDGSSDADASNQKPPASLSAGADHPPSSAPPPSGMQNEELLKSFEQAWDAYGKKGTKQAALRYWKRLSKKDRAAILAAIPQYVASRPDKKFRKDFNGWINPANRMWEDEVILNEHMAEADKQAAEEEKLAQKYRRSA